MLFPIRYRYKKYKNILYAITTKVLTSYFTYINNDFYTNLGIGLPNLGIGFQVVPSDHNTNHHNYGSSGPNVLDLLQNTGDKASSLIRDVGDRTRWILKEKINTKVKAIRNILPKIPSGYSFPSASYGLPYQYSEIIYPDSSPSTPFGNVEPPRIATATVKSTQDSELVYISYAN